MTIYSPLAMTLRDVRHGRAALDVGYPWRAKLAVATAEEHLTAAFERLREMIRSTSFDDEDGFRRLAHYRRRVRDVAHILGAFAVEVEAQLPCSLNAKSKEKNRHG